LILEGLEDRVLLTPTTYLVTNTSNDPSAAGSLPWAINQANNQGSPGYAPANPAGSVIQFTPTGFSTLQTITLSSTLVLSETDGPEAIQGPGANLLTISGNNAVGVFQVSSGTTATLSSLTVSGGSATNGGGIDNAGTLTVADSTVENSVASNDGGGINNSGTLTVTDSTIAGNGAANNGGGIENTGTLTLTNSTIAENDSNVGNIGGIDNAGTMTAINTTVAYNTSVSLGAGLYDEPGASTTLDDTIIALNSFQATAISVPTYDDLTEYDVAGGPISSASADNLIGLGGSGGLMNEINGNEVGVANPELASGLADNGGPTQTIALLPGSPAIDAGSSNTPGVVVPTTDQRGFTRPGYENGVVDIGAFESPAFGDPTVYTVTDTSDSASDTGSLRHAIDQANVNTNPGGSVIEFDPTVFNPTSPQTITLTSTLGLSELSWPEVIQGPGANALTISGNNAVTVFQVDSSATATISGLTITGGFGSTASIYDGVEGGDGGGIENFGALAITDCTLTTNSSAPNGVGGGIFNNQDCFLTVIGCTLTDNSSGGGGGAIFNAGAAAITNSTLTNNNSYVGGGIENLCLATITDSTIAANVSESFGGGIENLAGAMTMSGCAIDHNSASVNGGGLDNEEGVMVITDSTIADNSAASGGGIWGTGPVALLMLTNSTIAYNSASSNTPPQGGGGGGLAGGLVVTLDNTIVALNTDPNGEPQIEFEVSVCPASENNLIGVGSSGGLTSGVNGNQVGVANPGLGSLANYGGPTQTIALLPGSPAIDAGSDCIPGVTVPTTDQRGALRGPAGLDAGSAVDIGAYEDSSSYLVTSTAASTDVGTLQTAIGWANVNTNANPANAASPAPNTLVFAPPDTQSLDQDLAAIGSLAVSNSSPLPITIDLGPITYRNTDSNGNTLPIDATSPGGVALTLNGPPSGTATLYDLVTSGAVTVQSNVDVIGNSPALVVNSGVTTIANGVTLVTATNGPTIVVNGGTLVVRDSTVEQTSAASSQPAILIAGGTADLGTVSSSGGNTLNVSGTGGLIQNTTGTAVSAVGDTFEVNGTAVASNFGTVSLSAPAAQTSNKAVPQPFNLGSLTDTVMDSQTWTVDVNWGDGSQHTDFNATSTGPLGSQSHAFALPGTYTVTVTATDPIGSGATAWDLVQTFIVTVAPSVLILDPTAGGALSLSGNASLKIPGAIVVDSTSSSAVSASGNASVNASVIDVHGKVQKSGNASFNPAPTAGAPVMPDPLGSLSEPSTSGLTSQGSVSLSGNTSKTIPQGIYSSISVSGNASLTLGGGTYIIEGGGLSVSGSASISGTGVLIVNAGSKYATGPGGTYGSISLSGNGSYKLTPMTTGTYAGIVIFQTRDNTRAMTVSGNASGMTGTIYAPAAQLSESGNSSLNAALIVDMLSISGNGVANTGTLDSPSGTVAYTPAQIRAAYGISSLSLDGTGQTIAIVDGYDDPSIYQALDAFDQQFGLTGSGPTLYAQYGPASSFLTVLNQYGQATSLPSTDPNGPGTVNWELEEALDVEWAHATAPGAQIVLVEADSQSLSDLMAAAATAAAQPGVSVVSMSWGFSEGESVFAADEANYDPIFNVPGVTFLASTGDFGAADPQYPAFSPNVIAVGGTSLTLNADNSYNSETGWGYYSASAGALIGSGGGISLYEPEPSYQQGVQSTGYRTTPDVSMVADPTTGAWIADPYNLNPSDPFEVVGGTSLSAPAWAGLVALINQGRVAAGKSILKSTGLTEAQQALYSLPQSDYNVISSGNNGYTAETGYNLVTGLGTPVASRLVPDLVAYAGPATTYPGPTVGPLQDAALNTTGLDDSGEIDVFSVFDALMVNGGFGAPGHGTPTTGMAAVSVAARQRNTLDASDGIEWPAWFGLETGAGPQPPLTPPSPRGGYRWRLVPLRSPLCEGGARGVPWCRCNASVERSGRCDRGARCRPHRLVVAAVRIAPAGERAGV
jgi:hypothetical protein